MWKWAENICTIVLYFPAIKFYRRYPLNQDCNICPDLPYYFDHWNDDTRVFVLTKHKRKADKMQILAHAAELARTGAPADLEEMIKRGLIEKRFNPQN